MRMPIRLWLLFSFTTGLSATSAFGQVSAYPLASQNSMRVDPSVQRERDTTRMSILQDELAKETRELGTAETEWRNAQVARTPPDKVQDISARVTLHRQNVTALEREIGLVKNRPVSIARNDDLVETPTRSRTRQPDDWLIFRPQLPEPDQNAAPKVLVRRRLPLAAPTVSQPQWIIQAGLKGLLP
ncbi:hypothetical protein PG1C_09445 [Rugosibacter aromaticivorans]|uniref:Uncharacterized protein n=1 Tax=Rugosibacter aromaticivorans TaxID=1565605 RepID=A0A0C5J0P7_9PROT|nr:hypothetical protein [Rugosibacter aromaticivorans]AJP48607.1 hypothetical protein PG1C_09445 [Rugosibacter aromaticivorans]